MLFRFAGLCKCILDSDEYAKQNKDIQHPHSLYEPLQSTKSIINHVRSIVPKPLTPMSMRKFRKKFIPSTKKDKKSKKHRKKSRKDYYKIYLLI